MKVFTPTTVAESTGSKYLGVLVAAKYARRLNEIRRSTLLDTVEISDEPQEKLTTVAMEELTTVGVEHRMVHRQRPASHG